MKPKLFPKNKSSGGPITLRGKQIVRSNALTHGLRSSAKLLLPTERKSDLQQIVDGIRQSFSPVDCFDERLVEDLAWIELRLDRLRRHDRAICLNRFEKLKRAAGRPPAISFENTKNGPPPPLSRQAIADIAALPPESDLEFLTRLEAHLQRRRDKIVATLERRAALRRSDGNTPPGKTIFLGVRLENQNAQSNPAQEIQINRVLPRALPSPETVFDAAKPLRRSEPIAIVKRVG